MGWTRGGCGVVALAAALQLTGCLPPILEEATPSESAPAAARQEAAPVAEKNPPPAEKAMPPREAVREMTLFQSLAHALWTRRPGQDAAMKAMLLDSPGESGEKQGPPWERLAQGWARIDRALFQLSVKGGGVPEEVALRHRETEWVAGQARRSFFTALETGALLPEVERELTLAQEARGRALPPGELSVKELERQQGQIEAMKGLLRLREEMAREQREAMGWLLDEEDRACQLVETRGESLPSLPGSLSPDRLESLALKRRMAVAPAWEKLLLGHARRQLLLLAPALSRLWEKGGTVAPEVLARAARDLAWMTERLLAVPAGSSAPSGEAMVRLRMEAVAMAILVQLHLAIAEEEAVREWVARGAGTSGEGASPERARTLEGQWQRALGLARLEQARARLYRTLGMAAVPEQAPETEPELAALLADRQQGLSARLEEAVRGLAAPDSTAVGAPLKTGDLGFQPTRAGWVPLGAGRGDLPFWGFSASLTGSGPALPLAPPVLAARPVVMPPPQVTPPMAALPVEAAPPPLPAPLLFAPGQEAPPPLPEGLPAGRTYLDFTAPRP